MNLGIEDAFVFVHCAFHALNGDPNGLSDCGKLRHDVHFRVVGQVDKLLRLARGQPTIVGLLRRLAIPAMTTFGPTRRAMIKLFTGLDHPIQIDAPSASATI